MNSSARNFSAFRLASVFAAMFPQNRMDAAVLEQQLAVAAPEATGPSYSRPVYKHRNGGKCSPRHHGSTSFKGAKNYREERRAMRRRMSKAERRQEALKSMLSHNPPIYWMDEEKEILVIENLRVSAKELLAAGGQLPAREKLPVVDKFAAFRL